MEMNSHRVSYARIRQNGRPKQILTMHLIQVPHQFGTDTPEQAHLELHLTALLPVEKRIR